MVSGIMAELPSLMEKSLKTELENNLLLTQCSVLEGRLEIVKRSIANERDKQKDLRDRLAKLRNGVRSADNTPPETSRLSSHEHLILHQLTTCVCRRHDRPLCGCPRGSSLRR